MVRFICILIGAYNLFILPKVWALASFYLFDILPSAFDKLGVVLYLLFIIFLIVHSIRLIIFKISSIKIQYILCSLDPIIRIISSILFINSPHEIDIPITNIIISQVIFIAIDIFLIFYLRSKKVNDVFEHAVLWQEEKYRQKLMKKNLGNIS
jgi:hypothetical protein